MQNTGSDTCNLILKVFSVDGFFVSKSIAIGVFDEVNAFGQRGKVFDVMNAVAVVILHSLGIPRAVFSGKLGSIKSAFVFRRFETEIVWNPIRVRPNVHVIGLAALRLRDVGAAFFIKRNRDWIGNWKVRRPLGELQRFGVGLFCCLRGILRT